MPGYVTSDGLLNDLDHLGVVGNVDLAFSFSAGVHEACQLELCQVVADGGDRLVEFLGQRADVALTVREQVYDVQSRRRRQHAEHPRDVLEQIGGQRSCGVGLVCDGHDSPVGSDVGMLTYSKTLAQAFDCCPLLGCTQE
jgi:hypothetical protein